MVNAPAFLRRGGGGGSDDTTPLLPVSSSPELQGQFSAFAAPAQQALGGFTENGDPRQPQPSSSSFTFGRGTSLGAAPQPSLLGGQERSLDPPIGLHGRSSSFTFGGAPPMAGFQPFPTAPSLPPVPGYSFSGGRVIPMAQAPMMPMHPHQQFHPVNVASNPNAQGKPAKTSSKLVKLLNTFSFLVLFISAPLGVWFSYYLWYSTAVLFAGPLASGIAMMAIFFTKWGCCGNLESSIRRMKFLVTLSAIFDMIGAIVTPMVEFGVVCPDDQVLNCAYDKPIGEGFSIVAGVIMFIHACLCIVTRFRAKYIVTTYFHKGGEEEVYDPDPPVGFPLVPTFPQYPGYPGMWNSRPPMVARPFPSPRASGQQKQGVPHLPRAVRFVG